MLQAVHTVKIPNLITNIKAIKEDIKNTVVDQSKYKIVKNQVEKDKKSLLIFCIL